MTIFPIILAKSDLGGLIIFLLVVAFWVLSALANWVKKQQEAAQRRQVRESLSSSIPASTPASITASTAPTAAARRLQNLPRVQPPWRGQSQSQSRSPSQPQRRTPARGQAQVPVPPRQQAQPARRSAKRQQATTARVGPPPLPEVAASGIQSLPPTKQDIAATEIRSPAAGGGSRSVSANATTLHQWLRPATLRQQFILTEVLQPPLALRESHR